MALADHDYTAVEVVAEAMEAMEVNEEVDNQGRRGEKTAEALSSIAKAAEAEDESGVDLGFDALMNLEENNDLAQFMQCGDIRLLWNLADMSGVSELVYWEKLYLNTEVVRTGALLYEWTYAFVLT